MYADNGHGSNMDVKVQDGTTNKFIKLWSISKGNASTSWMQTSIVFDTDTPTNVSTSFKFAKKKKKRQQFILVLLSSFQIEKHLSIFLLKLVFKREPLHTFRIYNIGLQTQRVN